MDAAHQNKDDVTPCPVCDLNKFNDAQKSSAAPSEDDLSVHLLEKHNVQLSHKILAKILAKSFLDTDTSKETMNDVEEIAQDFLLALKNSKLLNDENSFLRRKLLETQALCKNMAGILWKGANDASNAGRGEFSPEAQIVRDEVSAANQENLEFNPVEQTCTQVSEQIVVDEGSLDQSEFSRKEQVQAQFTGSSSQAQVDDRTSIFQNQNMEPQVSEQIIVDEGSLDQSEFSLKEQVQTQFTGSSSQAQVADETSIFQNQILTSHQNMEPQVSKQIVVDERSLDQSEFSLKEQVQTQFTGSSSQAQVADGTSIFQNQILTSNQNMEPQAVGKEHLNLTDESLEIAKNGKATKTSSPDILMESSSNGLKSDKKIKVGQLIMTREEFGAKSKAKLKEFSALIEVSGRNLQRYVDYAENLKTATNVSQKEVKKWTKKVKQNKSIHLKLVESMAFKTKKLNDALKKLSLEEEMIDSDFCELLEEIKYKNKEVRLTKKRVLKLPEDGEDSDSDDETNQPINYGPPSIPRVTQQICPKCNKAFKNMKDYYRHKKEHSLNQFFNCKSCPQVLTNAATLLCHEKIHSGESALKKCQFCDFTSKYQQLLLRHVRSIHTKEKLFPCDKCPLTFSSYVVLDDHIKKHQDKTKKQCQKCNRFHAKKNNHKCK